MAATLTAVHAVAAPNGSASFIHLPTSNYTKKVASCYAASSNVRCPLLRHEGGSMMFRLIRKSSPSSQLCFCVGGEEEGVVERVQDAAGQAAEQVKKTAQQASEFFTGASKDVKHNLGNASDDVSRRSKDAVKMGDQKTSSASNEAQKTAKDFKDEAKNQSSNWSDKAQDFGKNLEHGLKNQSSNISNEAEEVKEKSVGAARNAQDNVKGGIESAGEAVNDAGNQVRSKADDVSTSVKEGFNKFSGEAKRN